MNIPTGKTFKTIKVDVKRLMIINHWHSGSPELPAGSAKKIQTEGRTQIKKIEVSKQNKNVGIDLVYILI
jgi:hypothetical protein